MIDRCDKHHTKWIVAGIITGRLWLCYVACVMSFVRLSECAASQSPREEKLKEDEKKKKKNVNGSSETNSNLQKSTWRKSWWVMFRALETNQWPETADFSRRNSERSLIQWVCTVDSNFPWETAEWGRRWPISMVDLNQGDPENTTKNQRG